MVSLGWIRYRKGMEESVMKKPVQLCILIILLVLFLSQYSAAEHWEKVVSNGFGDPANDYAWSMKPFKGKLYIGTINWLKGGEIWCSPTGEAGDWQRVYSARSRTMAGIRNLYNDNDKALYACTADTTGAEILRTTDGRRWSTVKRGGENRDNIAFRGITRFGEYLYAGGGEIKAQLYRSNNGLNWDRVDTRSNFESTKVLDPNTGEMITNNIMIGELAVFRDQLYAFTWTGGVDYRVIIERAFGYEKIDMPSRSRSQASASPGAFEVWRSSNGLEWEKVVGKDDPYGNGMGFCLRDPEGLANVGVTSVLTYKGQLYVGTANDHTHCSIWRTSDGTRWTKVVNFFDLGEKADYYVWRMIEFQDRLFAGVMNMGPSADPAITGAQIWASDSGDPGTFYNLVHNGFDGETWSDGAGIEIPKNGGVRSFGIFNGTLYAGTATILSVLIPQEKLDGSEGRISIAGKDIGCEVWKLVQ
ncbi:MAG: hypothetical protein AB1847_15930 [bacterium]